MSRIGKKSIILTDQVETNIDNNIITVKGPKGILSLSVSEKMRVTLQSEQGIKTLFITPIQKDQVSNQLHGLSRTLINNMIIGVTQGFTKLLEIHGVGYRSHTENKKLILNVGFSHPVIIEPPENIDIEVNNSSEIKVSGINKEVVGEVAAQIRAIRPPEPYKGKGIHYKGEIVARKVGKAGK